MERDFFHSVTLNFLMYEFLLNQHSDTYQVINFQAFILLLFECTKHVEEKTSYEFPQSGGCHLSAIPSTEFQNENK